MNQFQSGLDWVAHTQKHISNLKKKRKEKALKSSRGTFTFKATSGKVLKLELIRLKDLITVIYKCELNNVLLWPRLVIRFVFIVGMINQAAFSLLTSMKRILLATLMPVSMELWP